MTSRLSHEVDYIIDSACDDGELNNCAVLALRMYGNNEQIETILGDTNQHYRKLRKRYDALTGYAISLQSIIPPHVARGLACLGYNHVMHTTCSIGEQLCDYNFVDSTIGGCLLPFSKTIKEQAFIRVQKRTARRLKSPKHIRRYVKNSAYDYSYIQNAVLGLEKWPFPESQNDVKAVQAVEARRQAEYEAKRELALQQFFRQVPGAKTSIPLLKKDKRKIAKSANIANLVIGADKVNSFVKGNAIILEGDRIDLKVVKTTRSLANEGHGTINSKILAKDQTLLANLCVYIDDTPCLDQLAALQLHLQSGEEDTLLEKGNLSAITIDGVKSGLLRYADRNYLHETIFQSTRKNYITTHKHFYIDALKVAVFGNTLKRVERILQ